MIEEWDFVVRIVTIGASLMLLALFVAGEMRGAIKLPLVGLIIGVVGYLLNATPLMTSQHPLDTWIDLVAMSVPFWVWLFARRLFEREPDQRMILGAAALIFFSWLIGNFFGFAELFAFYFIHAVGLVLIVDLVRVGLVGRDDDLVEQRRIIRLWLPLLVAAQAGGILIFEMIAGATQDYPLVQLANTLLILVITLFAGLALLRTDMELLVQSEADATVEIAPQIDLSPSESVLNEKLIKEMEDGAYRETGLTITGLAAKLGTPEHRLRALINQRLGHRNFSAFLNRHRIAEAKDRLSDKEVVDLPILTIAMDLGYNSLPTFNRAFRAETGTTPSDYRREAIGAENTTTTPQTADKTTVQN